MGYTAGFQANSTLTSAWWLFRPDPTTDHTHREIMVQVNNILKIEATPAVAVINNVASVGITDNMLTLNGTPNGATVGMSLYLTGFTNATFLNGQIAIVTAIAATQITAFFEYADYAVTSEPAGAQAVSASARKAWLYYPETSISTSQSPTVLEGLPATFFIYQMEGLFSEV